MPVLIVFLIVFLNILNEDEDFEARLEDKVVTIYKISSGETIRVEQYNGSMNLMDGVLG